MAVTDLNSLSQLLGMPIWLFILLMAWSLVWKGIALWKSAKRSSALWFIVLLIVNTMGILEILYIFIFADWGKSKKKSPKAKKKKKKR